MTSQNLIINRLLAVIKKVSEAVIFMAIGAALFAANPRVGQVGGVDPIPAGIPDQVEQTGHSQELGAGFIQNRADDRAAALTPSISLMPEGSNNDKKEVEYLLAGSSQFQELRPLPCVEQEINQISEVTNGKSFLNSNFTKEVLLDGAYSSYVVNIANQWLLT